jgi:hypothetical protein
VVRLRDVATLALAMCLVGCDTATRMGEPVQLLTGGQPFDRATCETYFAVNWMIVDPRYGTAVIDSNLNMAIPVMWRPGFTGRRSGSDVVVLDPSGTVVAQTGRGYRIQGTYWPPLDDTAPASSTVWYACGSVEPSSTGAPA